MKSLLVAIAAVMLSACGSEQPADGSAEDAEHGAVAAATGSKRGPHRGVMLEEGLFAIELAIFESGVPPEYHAWPTLDGRPAPLGEVDLVVELTRLGGEKDTFTFMPKDDFLRGSGVVTEPHSFQVKVTATHAGKAHEWSYDSFEGRTAIAADIAEAAGIKTEQAGPATLVTTIKLYGRISSDPARQRDISARYPGSIQAVRKKLGDSVKAGETLAVIESDESLRTYNLTAPMAGVITTRNANPGEQANDRTLFTIVDPTAVVAELSLFPADRLKVRPGAAVTVRSAQGDFTAPGRIERIEMQTAANQSVAARVSLENEAGRFLPGAFVTADVQVQTRQVPLAVKTSGLQPFRDFTVVFEQIDTTYEVRMLELGETQGEWAEVLGGLEPGSRYVTQNSYLIKADVEKSGASHDH